jgi:hypothetical protein
MHSLCLAIGKIQYLNFDFLTLIFQHSMIKCIPVVYMQSTSKVEDLCRHVRL